jgi:hypothetical protein
VVVTLAVVILSVPHGNTLGAVHGECVAVNGDRGCLIESETKQIRMRLHHGSEIVLAMAHVDVLVNGRVG